MLDSQVHLASQALRTSTGSSGTIVEIDPDFASAMQADIAKFERMMVELNAGTIDPDVFRVFRLNNGIYGQRQGGTAQMVRVKIPWGGVTPEQLDLFGRLAEEYSRGWGHITTRQNLQFHYVELSRIPDLLREMAAVGLTTREACGDTVRNVMGCHLAGACPYEAFDITPWAEAAYRHFVRNPLAQRLPRKFKINFSGCETDCGQAMFNDAGVIAVTRTHDGTVEQGFRVFVGGGLGANPFPAMALEDFTPKELLLPTIESILRVFEQTGKRTNKLRPTQVGHRRSGLRRGPETHPCHPQLPAGLVVMAGRHPAGRQRVGRPGRRTLDQRDRHRDRSGHAGVDQRDLRL